ncbi:MAG TPA: Zn-dependent protease [Methanomassiliicoccales archaeon]|nr:Zn-dependent protease [Methanomassiliicoccales archaeon]
MYDEYGNLVIPRDFGRFHFGRQELVQIAISVAVLTAAFTIVLSGNSPWYFAFGVAAAVSLTGFLLHEMGHKFVAQRYGAWAEYRMYPMGLFMALIFSFLGFLFAAPGAVYIQGRISKKQNGLISLAGPSTNILFGTTFIILWLAFPSEGTWSAAFNWIGVLSLFLAGFNLIPLGPLDGKKVLAWSPTAWVLAIIVTAIPLAIGYGLI